MNKKEDINILTRSEEKRIEEITKRYDSEINDISNEIDALSKKRDVYIDNIKELKRNKNREIRDIKNSARSKKYKSIDMKVGDVFTINTGDDTFIYIGSKYIVSKGYNNDITIRIEIVGETPTQYRLSFESDKEVYSGFNYGKQKFMFNLNKLNFKDFLDSHSKSFKRELTISNLIE